MPFFHPSFKKAFNGLSVAPNGNLKEKIQGYRDLISQGGDAIRKLSNLPNDIVLVDFKGPKWNELEIDVDRNRAKASSWHYDTNNEFKKHVRQVDNVVNA